MAGLTREQRAERTASRDGTGRSTRVPLGVARSKLTFQSRPGYVRRVVNDTEGRLATAEAGGYQFVTSEGDKHLGDADIDNVNRDLGSRISRVVDRTTGQKAYLMEIKEEFYKEDQEAKRRDLDVTDSLIKRGKLADADDRYIPDKGRGISIETK